jgi:hypothetical protein
MAQKLQLLKLLQEIRGFADVGNRTPELRPLLQTTIDLRTANHPASLPVRRFSIPITHEHHEETPTNVPITQASGLADHACRVKTVPLRAP